jgi:starch-binding outer membrane protein, SusD/RagB family
MLHFNKFNEIDDMKRIKFLVKVLTFSISIISCKKSFLQEVPYNFISSTSLYSDDAGVEAAVNGCYSIMADYAGYGAGYLTWMTVGSGGYYSTQTPNNDMNTLTHTALNIWLTGNSPWDQFYSAINSANDIIMHAPKGGASQTIKDKAVGEAYFMRAMLYFNLVRMFGGVPLKTEPSTYENIYKPRATKDEVYALIISDLEKAKVKMTATPNVGRPSKWAAQALLGKVYIQMAGNQTAAQTLLWQKAKNELVSVVMNGGYKLQPNFATLFTAGIENTNESIIEIQYSISGGAQGQFTNFFAPSGSTLTPLAVNGPFGRNRINKDIFDKHKAQYATDPRIDVSYVYGSYIRNTGTIVNVYPTVNNVLQGWPYLKKYIDPNYVATYSNINFIYLRYADVLLNLAEAENEINGPTNAYQYVNQVLLRARNSVTPAATTPADWNGMTLDQFRDRIMRERRYELIGECHLWHDVRRRGAEGLKTFFIEHNTHPTFNKDADIVYPTDDNSVNKLLLMPIPEKEINTNPLINLNDQNFGY